MGQIAVGVVAVDIAGVHLHDGVCYSAVLADDVLPIDRVLLAVLHVDDVDGKVIFGKLQPLAEPSVLVIAVLGRDLLEVELLVVRL